MARMCCPQWWRRRLRRHQGRTIEAAAIRLGYVNKTRDLYISEERLRARLQQNVRNAAALESTLARNELGQEFTLAELASRSPANKKVRRAELMTRIAGFERIARELGHAGLFITLTCPSRFHPWRTVGESKVVGNPRYDAQETPRTAQKHLARVWSRNSFRPTSAQHLPLRLPHCRTTARRHTALALIGVLRVGRRVSCSRSLSTLRAAKFTGRVGRT